MYAATMKCIVLSNMCITTCVHTSINYYYYYYYEEYRYNYYKHVVAMKKNYTDCIQYYFVCLFS